jgi:hypothetical protein
MPRTLAALLIPGLLLPVFACNQAGDGNGQTGEANSEVKLNVVKHTEVVKALEAARGKVVLIDLWGEF